VQNRKTRLKKNGRSPTLSVYSFLDSETLHNFAQFLLLLVVYIDFLMFSKSAELFSALRVQNEETLILQFWVPGYGSEFRFLAILYSETGFCFGFFVFWTGRRRSVHFGFFIETKVSIYFFALKIK